MSRKPVMAEKCMECEWEEHKNPNPHRKKCPECGAPMNNYWVERLYAYNSETKPD